MMRKPVKPPEGAKMKETADMVMWKKEFEKMKTEDHLSKLKELGLDDEDLEGFKEMEGGVPLEKELLGDGVGAEESQETGPVGAPKKAPKKIKK